MEDKNLGKLIGTGKAKTKVFEIEKDGKKYQNIVLSFEQNGQTFEFHIKNKFDMSNSQYGLFMSLCSGQKIKK